MWYLWALASCNQELDTEKVQSINKKYNIEKSLLLFGRFDIALLIKAKDFITNFKRSRILL